MSAECSAWCGSGFRKAGALFTITPAPLRKRNERMRRGCGCDKTQLQDVEDFFVALEGRNEIRAGHFRTRPGKHFARALEATVARGSAGRFQGFQQRLRNYDSGNLIVEAQRLLVAVERPDADEYRNGRLATEFFYEGIPVLGIEERLGHGEVRAGFHLGMEALDFTFE